MSNAAAEGETFTELCKRLNEQLNTKRYRLKERSIFVDFLGHVLMKLFSKPFF